MKSIFKSHADELVIVALSLCTCILFFTLVADDYGSFAYFSMATGQFSNYPHIDHHYNAFIGVNIIYKFLSNALPGYNWMGIAFMAFTFSGLYLLLRAIKIITLGTHQNIWLTRSLQVLFTCFFIENIVILSHTRFSLLFCGISLFNLAFTKEITWGQFLLNTMLFILGMLHRPESSIGMLLMVSTGYVIYHFDLKYLLKRFFFPIAATIALFGAIAIDWSHTDIYVRKVEPEIEYKMMDRWVVDISNMKTAEDSVKYKAAVIGMWFDPNVVTPEFMRSLLLPGMNLSSSHASEVFFHVLSFYKHYLFSPLFIAAMILLCLFQSGNRKQAFMIILFQIATFLLIYALDFNGLLVADRHFLNLQIISLLITLFYFFNAGLSTDIWKLKKGLGISSLLIVLSGTSFALINYKQNNDQIANDVRCYELAMQEIENTYSNQIIVVTISNFSLLDHPFSIRNKNYKKNTYLIYDAFNYSLVPEYIAYLSDECNCNALDPVAFFDWLSAENALYVAKPFRYDLTERYMDKVHKQKIKFILPDDFNKPSCIGTTGMLDFEIRRVKVEN